MSDPKLVGLIGDPSIAGMDQRGGYTQQDVESEGRRRKGRLPTTLVELRQGLDNRAAQRREFSGANGSPSEDAALMMHPADRPGMRGTSAAQAQPRVEHRKPTDDELMAKAMEMIDMQSNQHQALLSQSSLSPRDASGSQVTDASGNKLPDWLVREQEGR